MSEGDATTCGHRLEIGLDDDALSAEHCDRLTEKDHEQCIWHAAVDGKSAKELEEARPDPGDDLDGAYLEDASLVGVDWFAGTSLAGAELTGGDVNSADFSNANLMLAILTPEGTDDDRRTSYRPPPDTVIH